MGKIILFLFLLIAGAGLAMASGYRLHPENIPYYFKADGGGQKQKITFRDGMTLTGVIVQETAEQIKVNSDGASVLFPRTQIETIESVKGENPWTLFMENYKRQENKHPLLTHDKNQTLGAKFDYMIMEPSRIADTIRAKHPEITSDGQRAAIIETARAAQAKMRNLHEKAVAEMEQ